MKKMFNGCWCLCGQWLLLGNGAKVVGRWRNVRGVVVCGGGRKGRRDRDRKGMREKEVVLGCYGGGWVAQG